MSLAKNLTLKFDLTPVAFLVLLTATLKAYAAAQQNGAKLMDIKTVAVIGAGQMGNGIAHVMAVAGYDVMLGDISQDALNAAIARIDKNLTRQVSKETLSESDKVDAMARIQTSTVLADMGRADLVIESATERETVKQAIFEDLLPHLKPNTILTSNTSSISITRLASRTDRPERFMGCLLYTSPSPRDQRGSRMPSSA